MDLNTTGHLAVLAEPVTGFVTRLGQVASLFYLHPGECTGQGRGRRFAKIRNRLRALVKTVCLSVSREIVRVARRLACGIKFERLFSSRPRREYGDAVRPFLMVQQMVESRARRAGVPVLFVDPTATSKRCHRCGAVGLRHRKRFECPVCGLIAHADVNAAINIAVAPCPRPTESHVSPSRRSLLRLARSTAGTCLPREGFLALFDGCTGESGGARPSSGHLSAPQ